MSVANSVASIDLDESSVGTDSAILSNSHLNENPPVCGQVCARHTGRRRWMFRLRKPSTVERIKFKGLTISCRCRSSVKGSFLILTSAVFELVGCIIALCWGLCYITKAYDFYKLSGDPEIHAVDYDGKLERVLLIEKNRVGLVGLLATCLVGLLISILMPIGTLYRNWKCLRASMTLLVSVSVIHFLILLIYFPTSAMMITLVIILFRICEFIYVLEFIKYYKRKKLDELKEKVKQAGAILTTAGTSTQHLLDNSSLCSFNKEDLMELKFDSGNPEIAIDPLSQPFLDTMALEASTNNGELVLNLQQIDMAKRNHQRGVNKRKFLDQWKREERAYHKAPKYDSYLLYDMPK